MQKKHKKLGERSINKLLFQLSLPAMLAMTGNALYNIIDTIFIGKGIGSTGIAAVSIVMPIMGFVGATANMIGIGAASLFSRKLGENNMDMVQKITGNAIFLIFIIGVVFASIGIIFNDFILEIFGTTDKIKPMAADFSKIIFIGMLWFPFAMAMNNIVRAEGNAKDAMYAMLIGFVLNIIFDYIFIFPMNMGIKGAAYATLIGKTSGFIYILYYFKSKRSIIRFNIKNFILEKSIVKKIFGIGASGFGMRASGSVALITLNNVLGSYNSVMAIAVFGIIYRITLVLAMPLFGLNQGMQPILGYNYGAKNMDRVKEVIKKTIAFSLIAGIIGVILAELFPREIFSIFTNEEELLNQGSEAFAIVIAGMWLMGINISIMGVHQALGIKTSAFILSVDRWVFFVLPLIFILPMLLNNGLTGIWMAFPIADILAAILAVILLQQTLKKTVF
ncbi:MAG: MATE family efflux transporter [Bacteroidota bacterium]|nr:MATE family efflux transporter [Bacteroidota bacterium]